MLITYRHSEELWLTRKFERKENGLVLPEIPLREPAPCAPNGWLFEYAPVTMVCGFAISTPNVVQLPVQVED